MVEQLQHVTLVLAAGHNLRANPRTAPCERSVAVNSQTCPLLNADSAPPSIVGKRRRMCRLRDGYESILSVPGIGSSRTAERTVSNTVTFVIIGESSIGR